MKNNFKDFSQIWQDKQLLFSYRESFLYTGMSASFRIEGKVDEVIDLLTQSNIKEGKKSTFCLKMFVGISNEWDAVFAFKLFIFFSMSVSDTA